MALSCPPLLASGENRVRLNVPDRCIAELPFSFRVPATVAAVSDLEFGATFRTSMGGVGFRNNANKPIGSVFSNVELRDAGGHYLFSVQMYRYTKARYDRTLRRRTWEAIELEQSIYPGEELELSFSSPLVAKECPSAARATLVEIRYEDGSTFRYQARDMRREALPAEAGYIELDDRTPVVPPFDVMTTLRVESDGKVYVLGVDDGPPEFKDWLQSKVEHWEFSPAIEGKAHRAIEFRVLFRFHREGMEEYPMPSELPSDPLYVLVDVLPPDPGKRVSFVLFGGHIADTHGIPNR